MFLILRGVEGDPRPLSVGALSLPPTVPWSLRLRKFQTRLNHVQPLDFVSFANWTSQTHGADSGGALLFSVFVVRQRLLANDVPRGAWDASSHRSLSGRSTLSEGRWRGAFARTRSAAGRRPSGRG